MNVIIRADASVQIGIGHIMRCLTLAENLRQQGAYVWFVCREFSGNLCEFLEGKGYVVFRLPFKKISANNSTPGTKHKLWLGVSLDVDVEETCQALKSLTICIDWVIVDHYALDERWERKIRPYVKNIMVVDDLADRVHDCDLLLDQNLYQDIETRYKGLVSDNCKKLLGPQFALLRPEFIELRRNLPKRGGAVRRIFVFFGGSDPTNETVKALEALRIINLPDVAIDVVVGGVNPHKEQVKQICSTLPGSTFYCQVDDIAHFMSKADLAIGAGGAAMWERCFLGLPSITMVVADNQFETTSALASTGAIWNLGRSSCVDVNTLVKAIEKAVNNSKALKGMGETAQNLMGDPLKIKNRVLDVMVSMTD